MSRYHLHVRFDVERLVSYQHEDRDAALTQAFELACAGAWIWVYGHDHRPKGACQCPGCLTWEEVAAYEPGGRRVR